MSDATPTHDIDPTDAVALTQALVRCPSVTPQEAGALQLLETILAAEGFVCARVDRGGVPNLFARFGTESPVFGFNGHTDVVPPGDVGAWSDDPFSGALTDDGRVFGRGSVDMKSGVAAFVAAAVEAVRAGGLDGSIVLLITGDEEGDGVDGTRALLDWMRDTGERMDFCVVGEPTSAQRVGDQIKVGRRGSLTAYVTARGRQGHSAYPASYANPLPPLLSLLHGLATQGLDDGAPHFEPSTLAVTTVDVGNPANNVVPAEARATVNIRYNTRHDARSLKRWLQMRVERALAEADDPAISIDLSIKASGDAFLTAPGPLTERAEAAIRAVTGRAPAHSTGGGTSDARFVKDVAPVVELGIVGRGMHQVDEAAPAADILILKEIFAAMLRSNR